MEKTFFYTCFFFGSLHILYRIQKCAPSVVRLFFDPQFVNSHIKHTNFQANQFRLITRLSIVRPFPDTQFSYSPKSFKSGTPCTNLSSLFPKSFVTLWPEEHSVARTQSGFMKLLGCDVIGTWYMLIRECFPCC